MNVWLAVLTCFTTTAAYLLCAAVGKRVRQGTKDITGSHGQETEKDEEDEEGTEHAARQNQPRLFLRLAAAAGCLTCAALAALLTLLFRAPNAPAATAAFGILFPLSAATGLFITLHFAFEDTEKSAGREMARQAARRREKRGALAVCAGALLSAAAVFVLCVVAFTHSGWRQAGAGALLSLPFFLLLAAMHRGVLLHDRRAKKYRANKSIDAPSDPPKKFGELYLERLETWESALPQAEKFYLYVCIGAAACAFACLAMAIVFAALGAFDGGVTFAVLFLMIALTAAVACERRAACRRNRLLGYIAPLTAANEAALRAAPLPATNAATDDTADDTEDMADGVQNEEKSTADAAQEEHIENDPEETEKS